MIIRLIILILLLTDIHTVQSQRIWANYEGNIGGVLYSILLECEDTTINNVAWKELRMYTMKVGAMSEGSSTNRGYVRHENSRTYWLTAGQELLMYDFNLGKGDTIELKGIIRGKIFEVVEVDSVFILEKWRRRQTIQHIKYGYLDIWVEGIGSIKNNFLRPGEEDNISDGGSWSICYSENGGMDIWKSKEDTLYCYLNDYLVNCKKSVGTKDQVRTDIRLYPNPLNGKEAILVLEGYGRDGKVRLYTISGQVYYHGGLETLLASQIDKGFYILELLDSKHRQILKLVVE